MSLATKLHVARMAPPAQGDVWPSFIRDHPDLEMIEESGKIRCKSTGHEMAPAKDVVDAYLSGKKYLKAKAKANTEKHDFSKYSPRAERHEKTLQVALIRLVDYRRETCSQS